MGEAASLYFAQLSPEEREAKQQEVYRFVKWFAWERGLDQIPVTEIARYAEKEATAGGDFQRRLSPVRDFLTYTKKAKLCSASLAVHLKTSKEASRTKKVSGRRGARQTVHLTAEEYEGLQQQLAQLKDERPRVSEEIRRAAADKDFRENAPLEAARERQGHIEAKIRELEATLAASVVLGSEQRTALKADIGDTVRVRDLSSQDYASYTLVGLSQVNPARGRISHASPFGKALMGRAEGDIVEVSAPIGVLRYRIEKIER